MLKYVYHHFDKKILSKKGGPLLYFAKENGALETPHGSIATALNIFDEKQF